MIHNNLNYLKNEKILFIFGISIFTLSCSNEQNPSSSKEEINLQNNTKRLAGDVYPEFSDLMDNLYGEDYDVGADKSISDEIDTFTVHEVNLAKDGSGNLVGYFVKNQTTGDVIYTAYNSSTDTADIYELAPTSGYIKNTYDLTNDPNYAIHGFSTSWEPKPKRRFWGWGTSNPGPCVDDPSGEGCVRYYTQTYYAAWIGVDHRDVMRLDKPDQRLTSPCDCP